MTYLKFDLESTSVDLPVEVRRPDFSIEKRLLTSESVELDPGTYYITAKMPSGQDLLQETRVEGQEVTVVLFPPPRGIQTRNSAVRDRSDQSVVPFGSISPTRYREDNLLAAGTDSTEWRLDPILWRRQPEVTPGQEDAVPQGATQLTGRLRFFRGNLLRRQGKSFAPSLSAPDRPQAVAQVTFDGADETQYLQILQPGHRAVNYALPASSLSKCLLLFTRIKGPEICSVEIHLQNPTADLIIGYRRNALLDQAAKLAETWVPAHAEGLLFAKKQDPIAAAVGAYALLRSSYVDGLHSWTENLKNWFGWLPDGLAIRGEHLARLGKHAEALELFTQMPSRGLPIFSDGITYAIDRLNLYLGFREGRFKPEALQAARATIADVQRFSMCVDFSRPITTFVGLEPNVGANPDRPNLEALPKYLSGFEGVEVSRFLL